MSRFLLALLLGGSAAAWFYLKLDKHSLERKMPNLAAAAGGGLFVFIIVFSLSGRFFA